jgi:hypothetical protein
MIKITIEKTVTAEHKETVEFVTERTPTEHREKSDYDRQEKVVFAEKREPREVTKQESRTLKLFEQQIENDADFDLASVIKAINKL